MTSPEPLEPKGKQELSSSVAGLPASPYGLTEGPISDGGLFPDFSEPLRSDLQYLEAALSYYWGGPASDDVRGAWDRLLLNLRDVRADYLRLLGEKADKIVEEALTSHTIDGRRFSEHAGDRYRHVKRGSTYTLPFGRAEALVQCAEPIEDNDTLTIYIGDDEMIFARPTHEFFDGRFRSIPAESNAGQPSEASTAALATDEPNTTPIEVEEVARIIRREMQDNAVPATVRSENAAQAILSKLQGGEERQVMGSSVAKSDADIEVSPEKPISAGGGEP